MRLRSYISTVSTRQGRGCFDSVRVENIGERQGSPQVERVVGQVLDHQIHVPCRREQGTARRIGGRTHIACFYNEINKSSAIRAQGGRKEDCGGAAERDILCPPQTTLHAKKKNEEIRTPNA